METSNKELIWLLLLGSYDRIWSPTCVVKKEDVYYIRLHVCSTSCQPNEAYVSNYLLNCFGSRHRADFDHQDVIFMCSEHNVEHIKACTIHLAGNTFSIGHRVGAWFDASICIPIEQTLYDPKTKLTLLGKYNQTNGISSTTSADFFIAPSLIPNAGLGLFSAKQFHCGQRLLSFKGLQRENANVCNAYAITGQTFDNHDIVFDPTEANSFDITVASKTKNFAPFINQPPPHVYANAESISVSNQHCPLYIDIIAMKKIEPNEEIYMLYYLEDTPYPIGCVPPPPLPKAHVSNTENFLTSVVVIAIGMWKQTDVRFQHCENVFYVHDELFNWEDHETILRSHPWFQHKWLKKLLPNPNSHIVVFYNETELLSFHETEDLLKQYKGIDAIYVPLVDQQIPISSSTLDITRTFLNSNGCKECPKCNYLCIRRGKTDLFCLTFDKEEIMMDSRVSDQDTYEWFQMNQCLPSYSSFAKPKTSSLCSFNVL